MATETAERATITPLELVRRGYAGARWLAGYPRSGAALVRTILTHCFGQRTASIYRESHLGDFYMESLNGLEEIPLTDLDALVAKQGWVAWKTHEYPAREETVPTIIIVRDGRRTLESLKNFYAESLKTTYTMRDLIEGAHPWRSWSAWVRAWAALAPAGTLWLRYEDVMADVPRTVRRIAAWGQIEPVGYEIPPFESLHKGNPVIFRGCKVAGNGGMTPEEEARFWELHGSVQHMLGYYRE
jgi:hypothetical protein